MASYVFTDGFFSIGGTDLSDRVKEIGLTYEAETVDDTAMGDTTRKNKGGLLNWSASIAFKQDHAASNVDATLFPLVGTTATIIIRADKSDGVGATNPNFTGTALVKSYPPFGNGLGDLAMARLELVCAGVLSRATS